MLFKRVNSSTGVIVINIPGLYFLLIKLDKWDHFKYIFPLKQFDNQNHSKFIFMDIHLKISPVGSQTKLFFGPYQSLKMYILYHHSHMHHLHFTGGVLTITFYKTECILYKASQIAPPMCECVFCDY